MAGAGGAGFHPAAQSVSPATPATSTHFGSITAPDACARPARRWADSMESASDGELEREAGRKFYKAPRASQPEASRTHTFNIDSNNTFKSHTVAKNDHKTVSFEEPSEEEPPPPPPPPSRGGRGRGRFRGRGVITRLLSSMITPSCHCQECIPSEIDMERDAMWGELASDADVQGFQGHSFRG